jgi:hypothetical protein
MPQPVQSGQRSKIFPILVPLFTGSRHADTRALHYIGTIVGLLSIIVAVFQTNRWIALGGIVAERNRPCAYAHSLWSFKGNLRMIGLWLKGRLDRELQNCGVSED